MASAIKGLFSKKDPVEQPAEETVHTAPVGDEKTTQAQPDSLEKDNIADLISKDAQAGVKKAEAVTAVWSKSHLVMAYLL